MVKNVVNMPPKAYEAAVKRSDKHHGERLQRTIVDFAGLLIPPSQCNTAQLDNYNQLQHPKHGNVHCFSV